MELDLARPFHATAILIGEAGILFTGPSGAGKSRTALRCLQAAGDRGWFRALVADDRVHLTSCPGGLVATCPEPIFGRVEVRGTGLLTLPARRHAAVRLVVAPGAATGEMRLPPERETAVAGSLTLPLVRLDYDSVTGPLAVLCNAAPAGIFA